MGRTGWVALSSLLYFLRESSIPFAVVSHLTYFTLGYLCTVPRVSVYYACAYIG